MEILAKTDSKLGHKEIQTIEFHIYNCLSRKIKNRLNMNVIAIQSIKGYFIKQASIKIGFYGGQIDLTDSLNYQKKLMERSIASLFYDNNLFYTIKNNVRCFNSKNLVLYHKLEITNYPISRSPYFELFFVLKDDKDISLDNCEEIKEEILSVLNC